MLHNPLCLLSRKFSPTSHTTHLNGHKYLLSWFLDHFSGPFLIVSHKFIPLFQPLNFSIPQTLILILLPLSLFPYTLFPGNKMYRGHCRTNDHSHLEKFPSPHMYIRFNAAKVKSVIFTLPTLSLSRIPYPVLSGTTVLRVMQTQNRRISMCLFSTRPVEHNQLVIFIS